MKRPSTSSLAVSANPTSLPSKYMAQVPAVLLPRLVGVKIKRSSSSPLTPGTTKLPVVDRTMRPLASTLTASTFSTLPLRPTSLPSKYMLQVPEVNWPGLRLESRSRSSPSPVMAPPGPGTEKAPLVEITSRPSGRNAKASMFSPAVVRPMSLPSRNIW